MESPDFDRWGTDIEGTPDGIADTTPSRRPSDLSLVRVAVLAVVVAALVALIVHFAAGGRSTSSPAGPTTHRRGRRRDQCEARRPHSLPRRLERRRQRRWNPTTAFTQCFGSSVGPAALPTASFQSPDFVSGTGLQFVSLGSTVSFVPAVVLASEKALAANSRFPPCLANALAALTYRAHGLAITSGGGAQATPLPFPPAPPTSHARCSACARA